MSTAFDKTGLTPDECVAEVLRLRRECAETLRDLCEWDGSPDALEIITANLRAAIEKSDDTP